MLKFDPAELYEGNIQAIQEKMKSGVTDISNLQKLLKVGRTLGIFDENFSNYVTSEINNSGQSTKKGHNEDIKGQNDNGSSNETISGNREQETGNTEDLSPELDSGIPEGNVPVGQGGTDNGKHAEEIGTAGIGSVSDVQQLKTQNDVDSWMLKKSKEYGSKGNFTSSEEYKKAYPKLKRINDFERSESFRKNNTVEIVKQENGKYSIKYKYKKNSYMAGSVGSIGIFSTASMAEFDNMNDAIKYANKYNKTVNNNFETMPEGFNETAEEIKEQASADLKNTEYINSVKEYRGKRADKNNVVIADLLKQYQDTPVDEIPEEVKQKIREYEGGGGQSSNEESAAEGTQVLHEFYTPRKVINKMWEALERYIPKGSRILEPAAGPGRMLEGRTQDYKFEMLEIDDNSSQIAGILHPDVPLRKMPFEEMFIDKIKGKSVGFQGEQFDAVVTNPPYGKMQGDYKRLEGKDWTRYEHYFIHRSLDSVKEGGTVAMVIPSSFLNDGQTGSNSKMKKAIFDKAELVEAYRMPEGTFTNTSVGTDVVILRKNTSAEKDNKHAWDGSYFKKNPDHIMGELKKRKSRFGNKIETFVHGKVDQFANFTLPEAKPMSEAHKKAISEGLLGNNNAAGKHNVKKKAEANKRTNKKTEQKKQDLNKSEEIAGIKEPHVTYSQDEFNKKYGTTSDPKDLEILLNTDVNGIIDRSVEFDKTKMAVYNGEHMPLYHYTMGNLYEKLRSLESQKEYITEKYGEDQYNRQEKYIKDRIPKKITVNDLNISPIEPFAGSISFEQSGGQISLLGRFKNYIEQLPSNHFAGKGVSSYDILNYVSGYSVTGGPKEENAIRRKNRKIEAEKEFQKFIQTGLSVEDQKFLEDEWNSKFNASNEIDLENIPVQVEGLNTKLNGKDYDVRPLQINYVAKQIVKGYGCATHEVGLGKTLSAMMVNVANLKSGKVKRPMITVPTSVLQKWGAEAQDHYPDQKINIIGVDDLNKMIAEGKPFVAEEGAITIMSYTAFERFGFTEENYAKLTEEVHDQISNPNAVDDGSKKSEREKALLKEKAKGIAGVSKLNTSSLLQFDVAGFDHITVDEAHNFNNVFAAPANNKANVDRITGLEAEGMFSNEFSGFTQGKGSDMGIKMWLATRHIMNQNNNRNVMFLTATPFTNNPLQVYSMLSMLGKHRLEELGIHSISDFLGTFVETKSENIMKSNGQIEAKQTIRNFKNAHAFQKLIAEHFDYQSGDANGVIRPSMDEKPVIIPESAEQKELRGLLELLYDVKHKEVKAPALRSMTAQRIGNLSPALLTGEEFTPLLLSDSLSVEERSDIEEVIQRLRKNQGVDFVERSPKVKFSMDSIAGFFKGHIDQKPDRPVPGQIVFMDEGVDSIPDMKKYLMEKHGIPEEAIAYLRTQEKKPGTAKDPERKKQGDSRFTEIMNDYNNPNGKVKIILGSSVIKEGVSLNGNTALAYNLTLGWNPTDNEQKKGRGRRAGNHINDYTHITPLMEDSIDTKLFQKHAEKSSRINDIFNYTGSNAIDVSDINPDDMKTDLIRDPKRKAKWKAMEMTSNLQADANEKMQIANFYISSGRKLEDLKYSVNYQQSELDKIKAKEQLFKDAAELVDKGNRENNYNSKKILEILEDNFYGLWDLKDEFENPKATKEAIRKEIRKVKMEEIGNAPTRIKNELDGYLYNLNALQGSLEAGGFKVDIEKVLKSESIEKIVSPIQSKGESMKEEAQEMIAEVKRINTEGIEALEKQYIKEEIEKLKKKKKFEHDEEVKSHTDFLLNKYTDEKVYQKIKKVIKGFLAMNNEKIKDIVKSTFYQIREIGMVQDLIEIQKGGKRRQEGETWTQPSGRTVKKTKGKIIPVASGREKKAEKAKANKDIGPDGINKNTMGKTDPATIDKMSKIKSDRIKRDIDIFDKSMKSLGLHPDATKSLIGGDWESLKSAIESDEELQQKFSEDYIEMAFHHGVISKDKRTELKEKFREYKNNTDK